MFLHHGKLIVTSNSKIRSSQTKNRVVSNVGKLLNDKPGSSHLLGPVINRTISPELFIIVVGDGVSSNLVAQPVDVLNSRVVAVLVRHKESSLDGAAVGIPPLPPEDIIVQINIVLVDGIVKGDGDHLGNSVALEAAGTQAAGNLGTILGAEAVGQLADILVTCGGTVRVLVNIYKIRS